jgi:hypothetical protein
MVETHSERTPFGSGLKVGIFLALFILMARVLSKITIVAYALFAFIGVLRAEDLSVSTTLYCKDAVQSQVFESCEEIKVLEQVGGRVRAYSKPNQQVLSLKPETIFVARLAGMGEKIAVGDAISIASNRIWNTSRPGFLGLCKVENVMKGDVLKVSCGRYRNEKISRQSVYRLSPFNFSTQKSELETKPSSSASTVTAD